MEDSPKHLVFLMEASAESLDLLVSRLRTVADWISEHRPTERNALEQLEDTANGVVRFPNASAQMDWLSNDECGYWHATEAFGSQRDASKRFYDLLKSGKLPLFPPPTHDRVQWSESDGIYMKPESDA